MIVSGLGPGDEVITTPMSFCATANAIIHTGAKSVFVYVDPWVVNLGSAQGRVITTNRSDWIERLKASALHGMKCDGSAVQTRASNTTRSNLPALNTI